MSGQTVNSNNTQALVDTGYSGLATYGQYNAFIGGILGTFVSIVFIAIGVLVVRNVIQQTDNSDQKQPSSPSSQKSNPPPKTIGWIFIGIGVFILILVWANFFFSRASKGYAATMGANQLLQGRTSGLSLGVLGGVGLANTFGY